MTKSFINHAIKKQASCCNTPRWHRHGSFRRTSDSRVIQRFKCYSCGKTVSNATFDNACWQKKRHLNHACMMMLNSLVSMRRIARVLNINPKTVARKLTFLGQTLQQKMATQDFSHVSHIQFDELQTIEHTKLKPLSVAMAVSTKDRRIIGFRVASMPATGHLATLSRKKYGSRPDHRRREFAVPFAKTFNHDCLGYTPLNRTSVHSTNPSYPMCFQGRSTNNLKGKRQYRWSR